MQMAADHNRECADNGLRIAALACFGKDDKATLVKAQEECEDAVTDALTNLRHYCHRAGLDFDMALGRSEDHFEEETRQERAGEVYTA